MGNKQNLHTHTIYCDGKNTPDEMVLAAIQQGFDSIGFSGHSYVEILYEYAMDDVKTGKYKQDIARLKDIYKDKITIFCGLEKDYQTAMDVSCFDYMIGSVHCLEKDGQYLFVDKDIQSLKYNVEDVFCGDGIAYARFYYETVSKLPDYGKFDILGHFDLVTKFCEKADCFDVESWDYKQAGLSAIRALEGRVPFFEVNTGAMARGYRTAPYPAEDFLAEFKKCGFGAVITTDCHDTKLLSYGYDDAKRYLINAGFTHHHVLTNEGFKAVSLFD